MGSKGGCLQYLGICRKMLDTIMKTLAVQTSKTVKLGVPTQGTFPGIHTQHNQDPSMRQQCADTVEADELGNPLPRTGSISAEEDHETGVDESLPPCAEDGGMGEGEEQEPGESKGLKKAVSFHDKVEKIKPAKKKKVMMKRTRTTGKPSSMEQDNEHLPLKSILKVTSDLTSASIPSTQQEKRET